MENKIKFILISTIMIGVCNSIISITNINLALENIKLQKEIDFQKGLLQSYCDVGF